MKTVKFFTLGCKINQYDTQSIRERFLAKGFQEAYDGEPAGVCLVNTCTVTATADRKSRNTIRHCVRSNPGAAILVTGCLTEKDAPSLAAIKGVGCIIGKKFFSEGISGFSGRTRAFLKIQDGCDNFCSYCKVPLVRGRAKSKPLDEIIKEARHLADNGFKEIVISGICLGVYGRDLVVQRSLTDVIDALEAIEGLWRIRLSSLEPQDVCDHLIERMAKSKKVCRHLHISLQSGDADILRLMNRKVMPEDYRRLIGRIKTKIPGVSITTDVIVGFPTESDNAFRNTISTIEKITPLKVHIFPYSARKDTAAGKIKNSVGPAIIKERIAMLENVARKCSLSYKKQFLGRQMEVLVEECVSGKPGFWQGYTDNYIKVIVKSDENLHNKFIKVNLKTVLKDYILGE